MKIEAIQIKGLFNEVDHKFNLNLDERITILHGRNGVGKTKVLELIYAVFTFDIFLLYELPFRLILINFTNKDTLKVKKDSKELIFYKNSKEIYRKNWEDIKRENQFATRWGFATEDELESELTLLKERRIRERWRKIKKRDSKKVLPLKKMIEQIPVVFIETQRLIRHIPDYPLNPRESELIYTIESYSKNLAKKIAEQLAEYADVSQELDQTFPMRLVQNEIKTKYSQEEIQVELEKLRNKSKELIDLGILENTPISPIKIPTEIDETTIGILSIYIEDTYKKLRVIDKFYEKIKLFVTIINERFYNKSITVDRKFGIVVRQGEKTIKLKHLSSGEQHEIVMVYKLLFDTKENSLVLIDEPEISLHVEWQLKFVENLQKIIELNKLDILLATHSPQIISDRWDLTVRLERNEC